MPTREQLISALRQADAAGDVQAAQRFAELIKAQPAQATQDFSSEIQEFAQQQAEQVAPATIMSQRSQALGGDELQPPETMESAQIELEKLRLTNPALYQTIIETGDLSKLGIGFQRGLRKVARGGSKLVGQDVFPEVNDPSLQALKKTSGAATIGEFAGETAPFAAVSPFAAAPKTLLGRATAGGALGGLEGGTIAAGEDKSAGQVALSAGLGVLLGSAFEVVVPAINRTARRLFSDKGLKEAPLDSAGKLTPEAKRVLDDNNIEADDFLRQTIDESNIGDQARREAFEKLGLTPTQAQVTRDKDLFGEQVEAFTKEGRVTQAIERQDRILKEASSKELASIGGNAERASEGVSNSIIDKAVDLDSKISSLYRTAREAAPDAKNVRFNKAAATLRQNAPSDDLAGGVVKALNGKMEQMGVTKNFKPSGRVSIDQAEELRKFANSLFGSTNDFGRGIIREFKDSLDDDALSVAGKDVFKEARKAKSDFERGLSTTGKSKFSKRKKSLVRDILEEKIPEEKIAERAINRGSGYDAKSLTELKDYLLSGSESQIAQGVQAWGDVKARAFKDVLAGSFKGPVSRDGTQSISRAGIESAIKRIGPDKFKVLFNQKEREFITDLAKVAALREAPQGVRPSPSGPAIRALQRSLSKIPFLGGELANDVINSVKDKASEKRVLELVNLAEQAQKATNKALDAKFRQSTAGKAAGAAPIAIIPTVVAEEEE